MTAAEFKAWRARMGWTQRQVAEKLGKTEQTIRNWEAGRVPVPQTIEILIVAIGAK